jgi:hypothetical protein
MLNDEYGGSFLEMLNDECFTTNFKKDSTDYTNCEWE